MSSFEWMELQTLTNDIDLARSRLVEARRSGDRGRINALEEEISRAESRRLQLLAHISTNIVTIPEAAAKAKDSAGPRQASAAAEALQEEEPSSEAARTPEPAGHAKARGRAGARQASAPGGKTVDEVEDEPGPREMASTAEEAPHAKARQHAGSRHPSAP